MALDGSACASAVVGALIQPKGSTSDQTAQWKAVCSAIIDYIKANADVVPGGTMMDGQGLPVTGKGKIT